MTDCWIGASEREGWKERQRESNIILLQFAKTRKARNENSQQNERSATRIGECSANRINAKEKQVDKEAFYI